MRTRSIAVWTMILLALSWESVHFTNSQNPHGSNTPPTQVGDTAPLRYVRGVYETPDIPNAIPVIYDSYFPVMFEFHLPTWDAHSMKIQFWRDHNNCSLSDKYSDGYPCPVMFHTNTLIDYFVGNMTLWKNLFLDDPLPGEDDEHLEIPEENPDLDLPLVFSMNHSIILDQEFYCSKIVPHFANFQTTREKMSDYYRLLDKCENEVVRVEINLNNTAISLEEIYHQTFSSFVTDYWDKLPQMISKQATMVNLWTSLETNLLLHQFMETQKWTTAIESCQQSQIPWTLIDHDAISHAIQSSPHLFDHQLAIPLTQMSKYFKLPLTDCVFIEKDVLMVRILVPIRQHSILPILGPTTQSRKNLYKLIKFEPIIFHEDGKFCWIDGIREQRFVADSAHEGNLYVTECNDQEQKLCRIPLNHYSSHDAADPCAQALYSDSEDEIVQSCAIKCLPADKRHFNFKYFNFAHTYNDNFIYSLADDDLGITIKCEGKDPFKIRKLTYGAYNLTLPCGCDITGPPTINFEIAPPCHDQFIVEKIRPYHWRNISKRGSKPSPEASSDLTLNSILSKDEFVNVLDQRYGAYTLHYVILWLVIFILSIAVGVLGYFVIQLRQWRQHEHFKESRLIYSNMVGSPEDFPMEGQEPRY